MLKYNSHESQTSSHFFITTKTDNICLLELKKVDVEITHFDDDHLQDNVYDLNVVKVSDLEGICCELPSTIKHIFDNFLNEKEGVIIRVCVPENSLKFLIIERYIENDKNDHFVPFRFKANGMAFFFFINSQKTDVLTTTLKLIRYFYDEYGVIYN